MSSYIINISSFEEHILKQVELYNTMQTTYSEIYDKYQDDKCQSVTAVTNIIHMVSNRIDESNSACEIMARDLESFCIMLLTEFAHAISECDDTMSHMYKNAHIEGEDVIGYTFSLKVFTDANKFLDKFTTEINAILQYLSNHNEFDPVYYKRDICNFLDKLDNAVFNTEPLRKIIGNIIRDEYVKFLDDMRNHYKSISIAIPIEDDKK